MFEFIVICDDDPKARNTLSLILTKEGCIVIPCQTKQEALRMIEKMKPKACFLDISLNGSLDEEGIEIAKEVSQTENQAVIFLMSAYPENYFRKIDELIHKGLIRGILKKPVSAKSVNSLLQKIRSR